MFSDQLDKARAAVAEKNWRQAVHFLSIASALHPEHEEAKQMLKDARAEKRKSEESV
jgi:DNA polymerase III delta prime subunit